MSTKNPTAFEIAVNAQSKAVEAKALAHKAALDFLNSDQAKQLATITPVRTLNLMVVSRFYGLNTKDLGFRHDLKTGQITGTIRDWTQKQMDANFIFGSALVNSFIVTDKVIQPYRGWAAHICLWTEPVQIDPNSPGARKAAAMRAAGIPSRPAHSLYLDWRGYGNGPETVVEHFAIQALRRVFWNEAENQPWILVAPSPIEIARDIPLDKLEPGPKENVFIQPNFELEGVKTALTEGLEKSGIKFEHIARTETQAQ